MSHAADDRREDTSDEPVGGVTPVGATRTPLRLALLSLLVIAVTVGAWVGVGLNGEPPEPEPLASLPQPIVDEKWMEDSISRNKERIADEPVVTAPEEPEEEPEELSAELNGEEESTTTEPAPTAAGCGDYSGNRQIACNLLPQHGFSTGEMSCLDQLWEHESGWNEHASNPSSGAYGIPQALPGDKMASAGSDWQTNPATQISWGLGYIADRYGSPCGAWGYFQSNGWY
ncbi:hypothetical protein FB566_1620 [Stackebrandtia endophytica]|uniref:Transglycosylase-like protein with SLT domain n=1 Tax=Stackebrandtia endophytica TaxID=1496996 RepID=A0A543AU37_9ACTN|nr:hypothetical protein [Stackebrandtia endophytica]TQL76100.1 hypothetical protein FB566_1620 [Stackebrandtia endophytica]